MLATTARSWDTSHIGDAQLALQLIQQRQDLRLHRDIQRTDRLIEQQQLGLQGQCSGNGHPLALAARQLAGQAVKVADRQVHAFDQLAGRLFKRWALEQAE